MNPPEIPTISGPSRGRIWKSYTYSCTTTDPDGDDVYYWIDWGDGTNSSWLGPYLSGEEISAKHAWKKRGIYSIKVKSKDVYNMESDWNTFEVTIRIFGLP